MESSKVGYWLQVGANIGILAGLVLVALQMEQNTEITRFQLAHDAWLDSANQLNANMGEEPALVLAKIYQEETNLTPEELVAIDSYFASAQQHIYRIEYTNELGLDLYSIELSAQSYAPIVTTACWHQMPSTESSWCLPAGQRKNENTQHIPHHHQQQVPPRQPPARVNGPVTTEVQFDAM
jgi:hypothetical protein